MIETFKNQEVSVSIIPYLNNRGWLVENNIATHTEGITGSIDFIQYTLHKNSSYEYSLNVASLTSGDIKVYASGVLVEIITTSGYYQSDITPSSTGFLSIESNGNATIDNLQIKLDDEGNNSLPNNTLTWGEDRKRWVTFKDFIPEHGFSMFTKMYTVKDGYLYAHDNTELFNNFYGVQYHSRVKFPVSSAGVKTYHSIAIHSNKVIGTTEDGIETELGQLSDLITLDFETRDGIHYANFIEDKLLNENLKGRYIVIELSDEESKEKKLQIFKTVVKSTVSTVNE